MDDVALAYHVHCVVLTDEGEEEAACDEIGLEEKDWDGAIIGACWEGFERCDDDFVEHAKGEVGLSEGVHCWY